MKRADGSEAVSYRFDIKSEAVTVDPALNQSGIAPTEFKCLVLPMVIDEKSKGGIILPDETKDRDQYAQMEGTLIAVSPLAFTYADWPDGAMPPKPGDRVLFAKYGGIVRKGKDGKDYRLVNDKDISGVLT